MYGEAKQLGGSNGANGYNTGLVNASPTAQADTAKDIVATISKQAQHLLNETRTLADNVSGAMPSPAEGQATPMPGDLLTQLRDIRYTLEAAANHIRRARETSGL